MSFDLKELLKFSHTLKVLFAEDNYDVRVQLLKLLENFFSDIDVVVDGLEAYNKSIDYKDKNNKFYDLIITDLSMPKLDGIDLCKKIMEQNPNQLILVISAHTESAKLLELIDIGVYKFLQKPVDYKDLLNTLSSIISKIKREKSYLNLENEVKSVKDTNELLNKVATTDKLTSIYNRRYIDDKLLEKFEQIENNPTKELSIIFIDIDDFKQINDSYGHIIGDDILIQFSSILKSNIKKDDILGRWGGEEFIVICENCNLQRVQNLAKKLREEVENGIFNNNIKITASFGIAIFEKEDTISSLIQKADFNLYKAKKNGKNKVYFIDNLQ